MHEEGGTVGATGSHTPLGAALVPVTYFPLNYPKMGVLWLVGLSIQVLGWGDIGTSGSEHPGPGLGRYWDLQLLSFSPRQGKKEKKGKKISKTRDAIASSQRTDGAIRGQILRRR